MSDDEIDEGDTSTAFPMYLRPPSYTEELEEIMHEKLIQGGECKYLNPPPYLEEDAKQSS
eukprot:m.64363 g.64363  ORF g.64363 m.64363 type:complete len:60 (+) comp15875_c0_seq1:1113-1292(+)